MAWAFFSIKFSFGFYSSENVVLSWGIYFHSDTMIWGSIPVYVTIGLVLNLYRMIRRFFSLQWLDTKSHHRHFLAWTTAKLIKKLSVCKLNISVAKIFCWMLTVLWRFFISFSLVLNLAFLVNRKTEQTLHERSSWRTCGKIFIGHSLVLFYFNCFLWTKKYQT